MTTFECTEQRSNDRAKMDGASAEEDVEKVVHELAQDFDGTCLLLANELASSRDPVLLLEIVRRIGSQPHSEEGEEEEEEEEESGGRTRRWLSDELLERFESDFLPQVVQLVLAKQFDADCAAFANNFLQFVLVKAKHKLLGGDPCLLPTLARIFDEQRQFYASQVASADSRGAGDYPLDGDGEEQNKRRTRMYQFAVERSPYVSACYLENLEFWGEIGGFSLFLSSLRSIVSDDDGEVDTVLSFEAILCVFRTLYEVKDHLSSRFLLAYFLPFCTSARAFVGALASAEFQTLSRESLSEVGQVMEVVLARVLQIQERLECEDAVLEDRDEEMQRVDSDELKQSVQLLRLEIYARQFRSSSLEKRIYGLSEIVSLFTREFNDQVSQQLRPTALSLMDKLEYLVTWLSEYAVVEELFGAKIHSELIKRSVPLFQFASELECLGPQWLDLVWGCYRGADSGDLQQSHQRHEAHRIAVQDVLMEIVECLDAPLLSHLLVKFQSVSTIDTGLLTLLAAIAARGSLSANDSSSCGALSDSHSITDQVLTYLWEVAVPAVEFEAIVDQVLQQIEEVVKRDASWESETSSNNGDEGDTAASRRESRPRATPGLIDSFVRACITNVSRRQLLLPSLKLFTRLALLATEAKWQLPSLETHGADSIAEVLLHELSDLKAGIHSDCSDLSMNRTPDSLDASTGRPVLCLSEIKVRLLALRTAWIVETGFDRSCAMAGARRSQLDSVWQLLIERAGTNDEASLCFQWIELCMNTSVALAADSESETDAATLFSVELVESFLIPKFGSLSGDRITLPTRCCFHGLFRQLNIQRGGLETYVAELDDDEDRPSADEGDRTIDLATGKPLLGLEQLWYLAIKSAASEVAEECITLLASFYLEFVPEVRGTAYAVHKQLEFVDTCMGYLVAADSRADGIEAGVPGDVATVNRCVDLLLYFLEACDATTCARPRSTTRRSSHASDAGSSLSRSNLGGRTIELESLEERLHHLEIYPSPMKELQIAGVGFREAFASSRRPSWTFQHQHALLNAIPDEESSDDSDENGGVATRFCRSGSQQDVGVCGLRDFGLSFELDELKDPPGDGTHTASSTPSRLRVQSPTLRVRPNLHWPEDVPPSRGPDLSVEDLSKALQDAAIERGGELETFSSSPDSGSRVAEPPAAKMSARSVPSQLLANDAAYFHTLFRLVDRNDATSQRAWELICRLPTNNELLRKMIRLRPSGSDEAAENVAWMDQLDTTNVHRLLYAMRLVEALLLPIESSESSRADASSESARRQWRERFVRLGGARHLYEALVHWESLQLQTSDAASAYARNLAATCLAAVIRTLRYFVQQNLRGMNETWPVPGSCPFDVRLFSTTLPAFVRSICMDKLGVSAVRLSHALATSSASVSTACLQPLPAQVEEAIQCGVQLFVAAVALDPSILTGVFDDFHASDDASCSKHTSQPRASSVEWMSALLFECPSSTVRSTTLHELVKLTAATPLRGSMNALIEHLVRGLSDLVARDCKNYKREQLDAFFDSLLISSVPRLEAPYRRSLVAWLSESRLAERLVDMLHRHVTTAASRVPATVDDGFVHGVVQILTSLVQLSETLRESASYWCVRGDAGQRQEELRSGNEMVAFVLKQLIFGDPSASPVLPACRSERSRGAAQRLLLALLAPSSDTQGSNDMRLDATLADVNHALKLQCEFHKTVMDELHVRGRPWNFTPQELLQDSGSGIDHAGLVNPGCICYMNSLVQQLFMNPAFRDGLLSAECCSTRASGSQSEEVAQLQRLFVTLAFTAFKSTDPTEFALSHQDLDGNPTDLRIQMDADEFFCVLLDRIDTVLQQSASRHPGDGESETNSSTSPTFLDKCFGGVLVNQIITQQGHVSEREEKFFALSLEVSKKKHLRESLELYVQGESLEGENAYFCERLQQKVCATKRICIKTLPQTLVCHLKRFEFDFDTMEKLKINDYLEFPQEIDMFPFTSEALSSQSVMDGESMMYDLVGIVVHSGTSDMGHYYSFIKDRSHAAQRWLEFNDEVVREFDLDLMDVECFGGEEVKMRWSGGTRVSSVQMKRRNAYMLMYERREEAAATLGKLSEGMNVRVSDAGATNFVSASPAAQALMKETCRENAKFQSIVDAFGASYCEFLKAIVDQSFSLSRESGARAPSSVECESLSDWSGAVKDLSRAFVDLQACTLGCQYLFGVATLRNSTSSDDALHRSQEQLSKLILEWLVSASPETDAQDTKQCALSAWLLRAAVSTSSSGNSTVARSWVFDLVFLSESNPILVDGCIELLAAAVVTLTRQLASGDTTTSSSSERWREVLCDFYRALLELFYDREQPLEVVDPTSGGGVTLTSSAVVKAFSRVGALLESCLCTKFADSPTEHSLTLQLFAHDVQFLDRLLFSLQTEHKDSSAMWSVGAGASLSELGTSRVRTCTLEMERRMVSRVVAFVSRESGSGAYSEQHRTRGCRIPVDVNLVLNQTALANIVRLGLHDDFAPVLVRIALRGGSSQRDKLLSLLMTVLEDVKTTHLEHMLSVFGALLDAEEAAVALTNRAVMSADSAPVHCHVFSASKGLLEAATYYRDHHVLREYSFQLLKFCVDRANYSLLLRQLFASIKDMREQVAWITDWMVRYLDPTGDIRRGEQQSSSAKAVEELDEPADSGSRDSSDREVFALLQAIEVAFGCSVFARDKSARVIVKGSEVLVQDNEDVVTGELRLEEVVPELDDEKEQAANPSYASKYGGTLMQEHGPEVDESDEDSNNCAPATPHTRAIPPLALRASRGGTRSVAMCETMSHTNSSEA